MDALATIPDSTLKDAQPIMCVRGKNINGANRPTAHDTPRQIALKLLENGEITHRDGKILTTLLGIGIATRDQLQRLFWQPNSSVKVVLNRLGELERKGVLAGSQNYVEALSQVGLSSCRVYGLGEVGLEVLAWRNALRSAKAVPYNSRYYSLVQANHLFTHHVQTSEFYTRLKLACRERGYLLSWLNEAFASIRGRDDIELVRPDGGVIIQTDELEKGFFVEIDRHKTDWHKKVGSYERAFRHGRWQEKFGVNRFPTVLCIVPTHHAVERIGVRIRESLGFSGVVWCLKAWPELLVTDTNEGWYHATAQRVVNLTALVE